MDPKSDQNVSQGKSPAAEELPVQPAHSVSHASPSTASELAAIDSRPTLGPAKDPRRRAISFSERTIAATLPIPERMSLNKHIHHKTSVPPTPSPLGPGDFRDDLGSDVSGIVGAAQDDHSGSEDRQGPSHRRKLTYTTPEKPTYSPTLYKSTVERETNRKLLEEISTRIRQGIPIKVGSNNKRSSAHHGTDMLDPFVDSPAIDESNSSNSDPPATNETRIDNVDLSHNWAGSPGVEVSQKAPALKLDLDFGEETIQRLQTLHVNQPASLQSFRIIQPYHQIQAQPAPRSDLPIPPPRLPIARNLRHSRAARKKLDSQKAIREAWIKKEARKIANLARAKNAAEQKYYSTEAQEDYDAWIKAIETFNDATDLDKRVAERRNLFMPKGMTAGRTGNGNVADDGYGGSAMTSSGEGNDGYGRLFGGQLAVMERLTAEVHKSKEELGDIQRE